MKSLLTIEFILITFASHAIWVTFSPVDYSDVLKLATIELDCRTAKASFMGKSAINTGDTTWWFFAFLCDDFYVEKWFVVNLLHFELLDTMAKRL